MANAGGSASFGANITSRRRGAATRKPRVEDDDDHDEIKPKRVRSDRNDDAPSGEQKKQLSIVELLLQSHRNSKVAQANCFQDTVLDKIKDVAKEPERLIPMASMIDAAAQVYGYRVDNTHVEAFETRSTMIRGIQADAKAIQELQGVEEGEEDEDRPKKEKRRKKGVGLDDDWNARFEGMMEGGQADEGSDDDDKQHDDDVMDGASDDEEESTCDKKWSGADDVMGRLTTARRAIGERERDNRTQGAMLIDDASTLEMSCAEHIENDYYQKAISQFSKNTCESLVLHNARVSGDGRSILLHERLVDAAGDLDKDVDKLAMPTIRAFRGLMHNCVDARPCHFDRNLIPLIDHHKKKTGGGGGGGGMMAIAEEDEDDSDREVDMPPATPGPAPVQSSISADVSVLPPDMTILGDASLMVPPTPIRKESARKKSARVIDKGFRNFDMSSLFVSDGVVFRDLNVCAPDPQDEAVNKLFADKWEQYRVLEEEDVDVDPCSVWRTHHLPEEFAVVGEKDVSALSTAGLAPDLRDMDEAWNSVLIEKRVSREEEAATRRELEARGAVSEEALKRHLLPAGNYVLFAQPAHPPAYIPADAWLEEVAGTQAGSGGEPGTLADDDDDFVDAYSDVGGGGGEDDMDMLMGGPIGGDDLIAAAGMDDDVMGDAVERRAAEQLEKERLLLGGADAGGVGADGTTMSGLDDAVAEMADVPVGTGREIVIDSEAALRLIGKQDDAHWKANPLAKAEEPKKREKKVKEEKKIVDYFAPEDAETRANATERFEIVENKDISKKSSQIYASKRRCRERRTQYAFDIELFGKSRLLFKGEYGRVRIARGAQPVCPARRSLAPPRLGSPLAGEEEEGDGVSQFTAFMNIFDNYNFGDKDGDTSLAGGVEFEGDTFYSTGEGGGGEVDMDDGGGGGGWDDDDGRSHSPTQRLLVAQLGEDYMMGDDDDSDDEEKGEVVQINGQKYNVRQQRIDTSKMKVALKSVLASEMLSTTVLHRLGVREGGAGGEESDGAPSVSSEKENREKEEEEKRRREREAEKPAEPEQEQELEMSVCRALFGRIGEVEVELAEAAEEERHELETDQRVTDFNIAGCHKFSSVVATLPYRMDAMVNAGHRAAKDVTVANSLVVALHMCNENSLELVQERSYSDLMDGHAESWMRDFLIKNANVGGGPIPDE